ncbi:hypothetical protein DXG03_003439 [Asterophora parasitica]|uniref:FAD-binding FR-type domain-containing protein n=1 Tax=Asterophora parasitica TaxID=117018 RepID=A0A9P7K8B1_9AGAR|nr:hypothetical protein DXG03_003439 [Asterophora parasitica]
MPSPTLTDVLNVVPSKIVAAAAKTPDPDRTRRVALAHNNPIRAWYCVAAFIALIALFRFLALAYRTIRPRSPKALRPRGAISFYRLPSALTNSFRALAFRTMVPIGSSYAINVTEVFLTAAYATLIYTWSLAHTTSLKGVKYDPKYFANMAGNVASAQLSLVAALGTKNNIISFLTGVSFEKLNYLHRMIARVLCVLIWVHAAGRLKLKLKAGSSLEHPWVRCGILASTSLTLLCILSIRPLRNRNYEVFLVIHFLAVFITLLAGFFHARGNLREYYIWPAFIIWGLDRAIRVVRIVIYNAGLFKKNSTQQLGRVDVLSPHFVRITVARPPLMHWAPGQSAYLTVPSASASPFEAHPFTISTIDVPQILPATNAEKDAESRNGSSSNLTFLVRVRSGFTKRLLDAATKEQSMKVILDGPYSSPPRLKGFQTVVLIAVLTKFALKGGSGVAFTLPLLLDSIHRAKINKSDSTRVIFIWAVRDARHVEWISDALLPAITDAPSNIHLDIRVNVTAPVADDQSWDDDTTEGDEEVKVEGGSAGAKAVKYPGITIEQGRPDLRRFVDDEIAQSSGAISFNVCGTPSLANSVRSALRSPRFLDVLRGGPTVTLHVESYGSDKVFRASHSDGKDPTGRALIQIADSGENSIILFPGANHSPLHEKTWASRGSDLAFPECSHLLLQNEIHLESTLYALENARNATTIYNPSPMPSSSQIKSFPWDRVDWLIVNEGEAEDLYNALSESHGRRGASPAVSRSHRELLSILSAQPAFATTNIICTLGKDGVLAFIPAFHRPRTAHEAPSFMHFPAATLQGTIRDTTGAGDCFAGYFVQGLMEFGPHARVGREIREHDVAKVLKTCVQVSFIEICLFVLGSFA